MDELRDVLAGCGETGTVTLGKPILTCLEALSKLTKVKPGKGDVTPLGAGSGAVVDVNFLRKCVKAAPGGLTTETLLSGEATVEQTEPAA